MHATIKYRLSTSGQKASILAGGDGKSDQSLAVASDHPLFTVALGQASVAHDGEITLDLGSYRGDCEPSQGVAFDFLPSVEDLLAVVPTRRARKLATEADAAERTRQRTLAVLKERLAREHVRIVSTPTGEGVRYTFVEPDWPYPCDAAAIASPEAVAWLGEVKAANDAARAVADAEVMRLDAERIEARRIAAEAEAQRRADLGMEDGDDDFTVEDGALTQVPPGLWETHKRGKNWMATIAVDPKAPGGLARDFAEKAKGESFYILPSLAIGQAVEFGADYYSGSGKPSRTRWYGYVKSINADRLILHECGTGKAAVSGGAKYAASLAV